MNEKFNKNAKVEQLTKVVLSHGEEKALSLKILAVHTRHVKPFVIALKMTIFECVLYIYPVRTVF